MPRLCLLYQQLAKLSTRLEIQSRMGWGICIISLCIRWLLEKKYKRKTLVVLIEDCPSTDKEKVTWADVVKGKQEE